MCRDLWESFSGGGCWSSCPRRDTASPTDSLEVALSGPALLALIEAIHARGVPARFMVRGISMSPAIRDGDVIMLAAPAGVTPWPGEVVAFRPPDQPKLIVHRVVRLTRDGLEIQGDNNLDSDGIIPVSQLVGVVTAVERGGRALPWPDRFRAPGRARWAAAVALARRWYMRSLAPCLLRGLVGMQQAPGYRTVASWLLASAPRRITIHDTEVGECRRREFVLTLRDSPAAHLTVASAPDGCPADGWWLTELVVRRRYGGLGLAADLLQAAEQALAAQGSETLRVCVPHHAAELDRWLRQQGFTDDTGAAQRCGHAGRGLILRKALNGGA